MKPKTIVIIVAGGESSRFSPNKNKLLTPINGWVPLYRSIQAFNQHPCVDTILLVLNQSILSSFNAKPFSKIIQMVPGGSSRQESVLAGLLVAKEKLNPGTRDKILIHDAARPFISSRLIDDVLDCLNTAQGAVPLIPIYDAMKTLTDDKPVPVPCPAECFRAQTPQGFHFMLLFDCAKQAHKLELNFRDEAEMVFHLQPDALLKKVIGDYTNEKITTINQLSFLQKLVPLESRMGIGYDFHYFIPETPLVLGGIPIPFQEGLEGDSDGDVLSHAILEGLLGALSLGDMGRFFGVGLPELYGIQSTELVSRLFNYCNQNQIYFTIHHIDATLVAQKPQLSPYMEAMEKNLAECLCISPKNINIKATTDKGMDAAGSGRGIRCIALVSIGLFQEDGNE